MKPIQQKETKIIIVVPVSDCIPEAKKPKIHPAILKALRLIVIAIISGLNSEMAIAILLIKLLFLLLELLNKNKA